MPTHPDTPEGEVFLGNTLNKTLHPMFMALDTIYLGKQPYDIHGKRLDPDVYRPIFIHKSELNEYNKIMETPQ